MRHDVHLELSAAMNLTSVSFKSLNFVDLRY